VTGRREADALVLAAGTVLSTPFLDRLAPARAAGFAGVSMFATDFEAMTEQGISAGEIRARVRDAGLEISEVEMVANWLPAIAPRGGTPEWLEALLARLTPEHVVGVAAAVGARGVTIGAMLGGHFEVERMAGQFAGVCDLAAEQGLHVALEFIPTGGVPGLAEGWEVVRRAGRENGGLLVDSWHFFRSGSSLDQLATLPGSAIKSVQIGDAPAAPEADLDHAMMHDRLLPGEGELDLQCFIAAIRRTGTAAPIAVEVFSDALSAQPVDVIARSCAQAARSVLDNSVLGRETTA
jgi:sugar phosphate isomerase/epimerase